MIHLLQLSVQCAKQFLLAPSRVIGMKMSYLLLGVILGLLAVVHSTPVNTVTQSPVKADDDVFQEAVTEGFLINPSFLSSLTTESPKRNTTVQASQQPSSEFKESDIVEGSATGETSYKSTTSAFIQHVDKQHSTTTIQASQQPSSDSTESDIIEGSATEETSYKSSTSMFIQHVDEHHSTTTIQASQQPSSDSTESDIIEGSATEETIYVTTTQSVSHAQSSTATVLPRDIDISSSDLSTTQSLQSGLTSSLVPNEALVTPTLDHILVSQATDPAASTFDILSPDLVSGKDVPDQYPTSSFMPSSSGTETYTASSTSTADVIRQNTPRLSPGTEGSHSGSEMLEKNIVQNQHQAINTVLPQNKGHSTPGWIIIVAFIAGVAALVMLCVAIATRHKWNGPNQSSEPRTKTNSSNQQRELEMQTFLNKDIPRENGTSAEYTVIPLDELPENYSSH